MRSAQRIARRLLVACLALLASVPPTSGADPAPDYKHKVLSSARFGGRDLTGADFSYSVVSDADFENATLRKAVIKYAVASDAKFAGADLRGAALRYSVLTDARFTGSDCRGADFSYSLLTDADFSGADLRGANFSNAMLGGHFDAKTVYDETTEFPAAFDPAAKGLTRKGEEKEEKPQR